MKVFWINDLENGILGMMPHPKGGDLLKKEIKFLKSQKVNCVLCLIENKEKIELGIEKEAYFCTQEKIDFIDFPIKDFGLPSKEAYLKLINKINKRLLNDEKIVIHCRMGIGRTSIVTAGILIKNGKAKDKIFEFLSKKRTIKVPDTKKQKDWVLKIIEEI